MKHLLAALTIALIAGPVLADIQDPPMNAYTPTRKLGRGFANFLYCPAEPLMTMYNENDMYGNSAAFSSGFVRGVSRMFVRMGTGMFEIVTYPFPIYKRSYRPMTPSRIPWINNGYEEYPPEWGWNSRKTYCTTTQSVHQ